MKLCLYGKSKLGWSWLEIRESNGMVPYTPSKKSPWYCGVKVPFYLREEPKGLRHEECVMVTRDKIKRVFG